MTYLCAFGLVCVALVRILLMRHKILYSQSDEQVYRGLCEAILEKGFAAFKQIAEFWRGDNKARWYPPPSRVLYLVIGAVAFKYAGAAPVDRFRALSWISTWSGVLATLCAGLLGCAIAGPFAGLAAGALVGMSPLVLGLGRRALVDIPALAAQLVILVVALAGPAWWPLLALAITAALLIRDSIRTGLPGLLVIVVWLYGWIWLSVVWAVLLAAPLYVGLLRVSTGLWFWEFPHAFVGRVLRHKWPPKDSYAVQFCRGGLHRLLVDLLLVSPCIVILAVGTSGVLTWAAVGILLLYSVPWLEQQIRSALIVDSLLRIAVACVLPWWALPICLCVDLYIWYRAWWRKGIYDPSTRNLTTVLGMGK